MHNQIDLSREPVGVLLHGGQLWGYLLVRPEAIRGRRGLRMVSEPAIQEEVYRIAPPAPDDVDWADELGWRDAIIRGPELEPEIERLGRGELLLTGRTLSIDWLEEPEAERIRQRFFR